MSQFYFASLPIVRLSQTPAPHLFAQLCGFSIHFGTPRTDTVDSGSETKSSNQTLDALPLSPPSLVAQHSRHEYDSQACCVCLVHSETTFIVNCFLFVVVLLVALFLIMDYGFGAISAQSLRNNMYDSGLIVAIVFTVAAVALSLVQLRQHQKHFKHPPSQRHLMWILGMVPVYAICSLLTLVSLKTGTRFSSITDFGRTCYEAKVIYEFLILLTKYLGGHNGTVLFLLKMESHPFLWPFNYCFYPRASDSNFLWMLKYGCLQYVIIAPIISFTNLITDYFEVYREGVLDPSYAYFWCVLIINCSQLWALYCLLWFFHVLYEELAPFSPLLKFMVVKLVVFFTFWQGLALSIGASLNLVQGGQGFTTAEVQIGANAILICIEMFFAAIAHRYAFPHDVYYDGTLEALMKQRMNNAENAARLNSTQFDVVHPYDFSYPTDDIGNPVIPPAIAAIGVVPLTKQEVYEESNATLP